MKNILVASIVAFLLPAAASAQGEAALPFLLISPSAASNGMGEASVALYRDEPLVVATNPAHLGIFGRSNYLSAGYDFADWLPQFQQSDLTYRTYGFNAGLNLRKQLGIAPELSLGVGYSRVRLNLGTFNETSPDGPEVISTFEAFETAENWSIGAGIEYWVGLSAGYTVRYVNSTLAPFNVQGQGRKGIAKISTYDFGLLFTVPVMEIVGKLRGAPVTVIPDVSPLLGLSMGLAKNNLGDKMVVYIDPDQADPLPRYARIGAAVEIGLVHTRNGAAWRPVTFSWTRESNDLLVRRYPAPTDSLGTVIGDPPPPDYRGGFGDIRVIDDVVLGRTNNDAIVKTGWQMDFGELVSIRGGRFLEPPDKGNRRFTTTGYTLRLGGMVKILRVFDTDFGPDNLLRFLLTHIDIRYTHSELDALEPDHPLSDTEFSSWTLVLSSSY